MLGNAQVLRQHVPSPLPQLFACSESVETDHPTQNRVLVTANITGARRKEAWLWMASTG